MDPLRSGSSRTRLGTPPGTFGDGPSEKGTPASTPAVQISVSRQTHQVNPLPLDHSEPGAPPSSLLSPFEKLPVEVLNHILSYLVHPRSRLPGLTEKQSTHDYPRTELIRLKYEEDLASRPDSERWAADLFSWTKLSHPFNTLAATSKRCHEVVESYCVHLMKTYNIFKLPFAQFEQYGSGAVYPDLSGIIYRRLCLQTAPRHCVFCDAILSCYPHKPWIGLLLTCEDCFYAQALTLQEIQTQYHITDASVLTANHIRASANYEWVLRIDVEALALEFYGTRAFHSTHPDREKQPCELCRKARTDDTEARSAPPALKERRVYEPESRFPLSCRKKGS